MPHDRTGQRAGGGLSALVLTAALAAAPFARADGPPAWAGLSDLHLEIVPRTEDEAARIAAVTNAPTDFAAPWPFEERSAGAATVRPRDTADAFSQPSENLSFEDQLDFRIGNGLFRRNWVSAPSSTIASDGLGPLFNARSCQGCHIKDGRGHVPAGPEDDAVSMFLRVSVPGTDEDAVAGIADYIATRPEPTYGGQLQDFSLPGIPAEYRLAITYEDIEVPLSGGEIAHLRAPTYEATDLGYGPLDPHAMLSPRVAPQMIGLGLIEAIPAEDILAAADPDDADGDGISGRPNIVRSAEFGTPMLGRFGWKAGMPTIREQAAAAFAGDMGLSTAFHPGGAGDCQATQTGCMAAPDGGDPEQAGVEVDDTALDLVTFYSRNLGVPARRDVDDPDVLRGREVFYDTGCAACHRPNYVTHRIAGDPAQSFQLVWPYSDFLLHDMGDGLADGRPEARATGREWRTPPLWGIGMTAEVSGHTEFLHDGRARNLLEAVLWHGGEAQPARDHVVQMDPADRAALLSFLESL
ncbi:c-type cytochrome [Rhodobacterales bacterium HKCCE3408]|nr:c-type cytochrome [Rhodobacterales bacterium HKCCE3408]